MLLSYCHFYFLFSLFFQLSIISVSFIFISHYSEMRRRRWKRS